MILFAEVYAVVYVMLELESCNPSASFYTQKRFRPKLVCIFFSFFMLKVACLWIEIHGRMILRCLNKTKVSHVVASLVTGVLHGPTFFLQMDCLWNYEHDPLRGMWLDCWYTFNNYLCISWKI